MPFSAMSPDGPVSLRGADPATVESLRSRNRREGCFTAKCCGAPLLIRVAPGKAPHFVHKVVPRGCDGDRRETDEHQRLKLLIAKAAEKAGDWEVETEAVLAEGGQMLWRADVLASRRRVHVAFEVQLSGADYEAMRARQARYRGSGVRGLWFVRTGKGFPARQELPIFVVDSEPDGDWVRLTTRWDYPFIVALTDDAACIDLGEFVQLALRGGLKWAPFGNARDTLLQAFVDYAPRGGCPGCGRVEAQHYCVRLRMGKGTSYPEFQFAQIGGFRKLSRWYEPVVAAVWGKVKDQVAVTLRDERGQCCVCSARLKEGDGPRGRSDGSLEATLKLEELPRPRFGSVEYDWLHRWAVLAP